MQLFDRTFDICQVIKRKNIFPACKDLIGSRINIPIACPFKKGLIAVDLELRPSDTLRLIKALDEINRFLPSAKIHIAKHTFNARSIVTTKINNIYITIGSLQLKNLEGSYSGVVRFLKELFTTDFVEKKKDFLGLL